MKNNTKLAATIESGTNPISSAPCLPARVANPDGSDAVIKNFRRAVIPVAAILVDETFGREPDDAYIGKLAAIVGRYGLRHPITLTPDFQLRAGHRWLAAAKRAGLSRVEVVIMASAS